MSQIFGFQLRAINSKSTVDTITSTFEGTMITIKAIISTQEGKDTMTFNGEKRVFFKHTYNKDFVT